MFLTSVEVFYCDDNPAVDQVIKVLKKIIFFLHYSFTFQAALAGCDQTNFSLKIPSWIK